MDVAYDPCGETIMDRIAGPPASQDAWTEVDFETTFSSYYPRVVGVLCRMLGDRARAEELASDTFMKFADRRIPASQYESLSGWLYRTATRLGIDYLRSAARREHYESLASSEDATNTPLDYLLRNERSRIVRAVLSQLKPQQAQLLLLRSYGLSYRELALALEIKISSIGTLLARAEEAFEKTYRRLHANAATVAVQMSASAGKENH
jgi:RNA polymerase sigma-70 factor, ECF subfamily